ncbi:MAG: hypothetical protein ACREP2_07295 [Rhodanobacteraceae bacterium]
MSALKDVWHAVQTIAMVTQKVDANCAAIEKQAVSLQNARERLAAIEAVLSVAGYRPPGGYTPPALPR